MELINLLTRLPISKNLEPEAIQSLLAEMETKKLLAGSVLFSHGDPGDAFYVIVSGKLRISVLTTGDATTFIRKLGPEECIGEMSLLTGQPRTATVTALEDSELLCLKKSAFDRLAQEYPALFSGLADLLLPRFQQDQTRLALKRFFGELEDSLLLELLGKLDCDRLESGQTLFRQGEPGDAMYIIVQGRLRLVADESDGSQRILGEAGAGESLGEFALLAESGAPESLRTAAAYATRTTDLLVISRSVFEDLICQYPQILLKLTRQIANRVTSKGKSASSVKKNVVVTVVPVRIEQEIGQFAEQLKGALEIIGSTLNLNDQRFEQYYGKAGASETPLDHPLSVVIDAWLDERERQHSYTIYEANPVVDGSGRLTSWAQRCLEDADIILMVGEANSDPGLSPIEKALTAIRARPRLELVLLHPANSQPPSGTVDWLVPRRSGNLPVQTHHHVRQGNQADFRRLARRVAGKPIGLALAGGGARGWAHLGVFRALEEANLDVDWVAGTSMGAIMASGYAMDWSNERLSELAAKFSNPKKLLDYTLPYASVTSTKQVTKMLQELFAEANVEDTWRPFFCISANITCGKENLHTIGPLWKAVRASMALPGVFAPILDDGNILIDGGAVNNLPIDRMREMCPTGTVIGVDLIESSPVIGQYDFGSSLSGWDVLKTRISPLFKKVEAPNLLDIIAGLVFSNNRFRLNEVWRSADLLIKVPVEAYGLLEFDKYAQIIEAGYLAAQEQLIGFSPT